MTRIAQGVQKTRVTTKKKKQTITVEEWREYNTTRSVELRNRIVEAYLPLVRYVAENIASKLPQHVDPDDLFSAGVMGLFKAVESFDVERGFKFETYSAQRVRGAILDDLRSNDWVPRLVRQKMQTLQRARRKLQGDLQRTPSRQDLAEELAMSLEDLDRLECEARQVNIVSLSESRPEPNEHKDLRKVDVLFDSSTVDPVDTLQKRDAVERICADLGPKERQVLILYYYENLTMKEIGQVIGLSESRVSQIHKELCQKKQDELKNRRDDYAIC